MQQDCTVAGTLLRLRTQRGLTFSGLSQHCGLAERLLQQIEAGDAIPTLEALRALAHALDAPLGVFFCAQDADGRPTTVFSADNGTAFRLVKASSVPSVEEIYSFEIQGGHSNLAAPHLTDVKGSIHVTEGMLEVHCPHYTTALRAGDSHAFTPDAEHCLATQTHAVRGLLTLSYPSQDDLSNLATHRLDWPTSPLAWEGVRSVIERLLVDVCNGVGAALLRFRVQNRRRGGIDASANNQDGTDANPLLATLKANLPSHASAHHWPGHAWAGVDAAGPYIAVLPILTTCAFAHDDSDRLLSEDTVLLARAERLARYAETPHVPLPSHVQQQITRARGRHGWTLAALACEIELQRTAAFIPALLQRHASIDPSYTNRVAGIRVPVCTANNNNNNHFSSRIDVRSYDAFELLHPAYARQAVAMAQDILAYAAPTHCSRSIDIGTGPGMPLLMLMELLPRLRTLAVEPDDVAFACLQKNVSHIHSIDLHHGDFLQLDHLPGQVSLLTSTGASHHFPTARMFQKAATLLVPGGVFCVADEFLPEFQTENGRIRALIQHHATYIANTLAWIDSSAQAGLSGEEADHYEAFAQTIPLALIDLHLGHIEQAVRRCRRLYCTLRQSTALHAPAQQAIGMHIRFFWLELQAMVAGFDYEVECKTHPRRFVDMARSAGFELLRHRRLYATTGFDDCSGGTHLFTFAKPSGR